MMSKEMAAVNNLSAENKKGVMYLKPIFIVTQE
jgi:hypothetical protein